MITPTWASLPPTLVILGGLDYLHDRGQQLADSLQAAGVDVVVKDYAGGVHDFFLFNLDNGAALQDLKEYILDRRVCHHVFSIYN